MDIIDPTIALEDDMDTMDPTITHEDHMEIVDSTTATKEIDSFNLTESNSDHDNNLLLGEPILYIPSIDEQKVPKVGMCFETLDEAKEFYTIYGKEARFGIRQASIKRKRSTGVNAYILLVCSKEGFYKPKEDSEVSENQRKTNLTREGCKAFVRLKLNKNGKWQVTKFGPEHNHALTTPKRTHLIRTYRKVTPTKKCLLGQMKTANISTSSCINLPAVQSGGYESIGCTERDIRNYERDLRQENKDKDAAYLLEIFKEEKELNPSFFYAHKMDRDNKLTHLFWADGYGRKSYAHFSDVVTFDTTYDTNEYNLRFAPFVGINHHGQSVVFGSGLINHENIESFVWLFEKWLEAMNGRAPTVILTDEDPAMKTAIRLSFPHTSHRLCMWHILSKMGKEVGPKFYDPKFHTLLDQIIWQSESSTEFETRWKEMISSFELKDNKWLASKFGIRQQWIPAYSKDLFLGGSTTTQRSESMNAFFDRHLRKKNSLVEFNAHYQLGIKRLRHNELVDHGSSYSKPKMKTQFPMEKQMANIYTRDKFFMFQDQLCGNMYYVAIPTEKHEGTATFIVKKGGTSKQREVIYNETTQEGTCTCKMFESEGIPCRHILSVLKFYFIKNLPKFFISPRWKKNAKACQVFDTHGVELQDDSSARWLMKNNEDSEISKVYSRCLHGASKSAEARLFLLESLTSIETQMKMQFSECTVDDTNEKSTTAIIHPPEKSRTKGCGKRIIGDREKAILLSHKSQRLCHGCHQRGVDHDKRNCPALKSLLSPQIDVQASVPSLNPI